MAGPAMHAFIYKIFLQYIFIFLDQKPTSQNFYSLSLIHFLQAYLEILKRYLIIRDYLGNFAVEATIALSVSTSDNVFCCSGQRNEGAVPCDCDVPGYNR